MGGDAAGRHIYHRGSTNGKRVQCNILFPNSSRRAISFVGGDAAERHIYHRGSTNGKRVQCNILFLFFPFRAISFVGGDAAGRHIYHRGSTNGKRVQCNMGAKNHGVIMPDANKVRSSVPENFLDFLDLDTDPSIYEQKFLNLDFYSIVTFT